MNTKQNISGAGPDHPRRSWPPVRRTARRAAAMAAVAILLLVSLGASPAVDLPALKGAEPDVAYDLSWWSVDGGGSGLAQTGLYQFGGSAGQPDAGVLVTGTYTLRGGFWAGGSASYSTYLPLIMRVRR